MSTIMDLLANLLNPNPGQNRLVAPNANGPNYLTQTGLGPEQLARFHQMSGMGGQAAPATSMPQAAPPAAVGQPQAPQPDQTQTASVAPPVAEGGGLLSRLFGGGQSAGENQTIQWLQQQGMDPGTATMMAKSKPILQAYLLKRSQGQEPSEFASRKQAAIDNGLDPNTPEGQEFVLTGKLPAARGGAAELSLQAIPVTTEDGGAGLLQTSKDGKAVLTQLPAGVKIAKAPIVKDTGTEYIAVDPITQEVVGRYPKNVAGAAAQQAAGTAQGGAQFDLPRVEQNAQMTLGVLEQMKTHPGRAGSTGFIEGMLPSRTSKQVEFQSLVDQTQGQAFLQAFQMLKGAGQITEIEGTKATNAISRLGNQRLGDAEYLQAINDLEGVINAGLERARLQATPTQPGGAPAAPGDVPAAPAQPAASDTIKPGESRTYGGVTYKFIGGDPADPQSWSK